MRPNARPAPLRINKDFQRIRKPQLRLPIVQLRQPTIIRIYSPKVIHTQPDEFMSLVQRLTGRVNVQANDHFTSYPTALTSPLASASPDLLTGGINLNLANVGGFTSPRTFQPQQVKAHEAPLNVPGYEHNCSLTLTPFFLPSPASMYNVPASPSLWSQSRLAVSSYEDNYSLKLSPLFLPSPAFTYNAPASPTPCFSRPTPNISSQRSLGDLPFLSPGKQEPAKNLFLRQNTVAPPQLARHPASISKVWYQQFLADLLSISPQE